jgi:FtsP/CotA-like multicopper oxidase with cupredoxin domain
VKRRDFLRLGGATAVTAALPAWPRLRQVAASQASAPADYTLRIATGLLEVAPNRIISTTLYNNQFPGPLIRLREGRPVTIDLYNDTDVPEQLHWHGQLLPVDVDGSAEEGTPFILPHGHRRVSFTPGPPGLRFYHSHGVAGADLRAALYTGQVGLVYIEPRNEPGAYDQEVFLVMKEFNPSLTHLDDMANGFLSPDSKDKALEEIGESAHMEYLRKGMRRGFEVEYADLCINGKGLEFGEPIRVKQHQRVLFHVLNGSATEIRTLALPGHAFQIVALDGNPVPTPAEVPVLWIAPGERVTALVQMSNPGVWAMADVDDDRLRGMGVIVEYAGASGKMQWMPPPASRWNYANFGRNAASMPPDETIEMMFRKENAAVQGFDRWLINGVAFSMADMTPRFQLQNGRRYRLRMRNASDDVHPIHLHRHVFELTKIAGRTTSGVHKDVVMVGAYQEMEVDFIANSPGLSLFHCHMQSHMDFGFMALFDCR